MTHDEIDALDGEALAAEVATRVMGWTQTIPWEGADEMWDCGDGLHEAVSGWDCWQPHRNIAQAHQVMENICAHGFWCEIKSPFAPGELCWAGFTPWNTTGWNGQPDYRASAQCIAAAISRCSLKVMA